MQIFNMNQNNSKKVIDSLEFYIVIASDYTKLVRRIVKT